MHKKGEKELADLFDHAAESDDPVPPAPDDEFQTIMAEMKRRGIEPRIRTELQDKNELDFTDRLFLFPRIPPPLYPRT